MTVSTVVAGLLPIMWSTRVGAEVMKPLATPVLGGMVSSLVHVLIVTPVLFTWLRERQLVLQHQPFTGVEPQPINWRRIAMAFALSGLVATGSWMVWRGVRQGDGSAERLQVGGVVHRLRSGEVEILVLSPTGALQRGRSTFTIEFRSPQDGALVDAGAVRARANMTMPGMVMQGAMQVSATDVVGRYEATAEFGMSGSWPMAIEWDGPVGRGSVSFEGTVQ